MPAPMLITKSQYARLCGVSASTITNLAKDRLAGAMVGDRLDSAHPLAVEYLKEREVKAKWSHKDDLFQAGHDACVREGRFSRAILKKALGIGSSRASRLLEQLQDFKVTGTKPPAPVAEPEAPKPKSVPPKRLVGNAAANAKKKAASTVDLGAPHVPENISKFLDLTLGDIINRFGTDVAFKDWLRAAKLIEDIAEKRIKNAITSGELVSRKLVAVGVIDVVDMAHVQMLSDGADTIGVRGHALIKAGGTAAELKALASDQMGSFIRPIKAKTARCLTSI